MKCPHCGERIEKVAFLCLRGNAKTCKSSMERLLKKKEKFKWLDEKLRSELQSLAVGTIFNKQYLLSKVKLEFATQGDAIHLLLASYICEGLIAKERFDVPLNVRLDISLKDRGHKYRRTAPGRCMYFNSEHKCTCTEWKERSIDEAEVIL